MTPDILAMLSEPAIMKIIDGIFVLIFAAILLKTIP